MHKIFVSLNGNMPQDLHVTAIVMLWERLMFSQPTCWSAKHAINRF